jgi:hypothetical protein
MQAEIILIPYIQNNAHRLSFLWGLVKQLAKFGLAMRRAVGYNAHHQMRA